MKNYLYISLFAAAALTTACSNEEWNDTLKSDEGVSTIQAVIAASAPQTRTTLSGTTLKWATGDVMGVACNEGVKRFVSLSASATATFTGPVITDPTKAYYPFSEVDGDGFSDDNKLTLTLPAERNFILNATNSPMVAKHYNEGFAFEHLCGLMSFRLNSITKNVKKVVLTSDDQPLAGTFTIDLSVDEPSIEANKVINGSKSVSFLIDQAQTGSKTFYFPLPVATYSKLTVSMRDADDNVLFEKSVSNKTITRGMWLNMNTLTTLIMKPSEVKATLEALLDESSSHDVTIQLSEVTDEDNVVEIPKAMGSGAAVHLWLPKGNTHKLVVKEAPETQGVNYLYQVDVCVPESGEEVTIEGKWTETPEWVDSEGAPDVDMQLPNISYIYIKSNDLTTQEARLGALTVEPKSRTYILHANIRVNQLNVAKGSVYVNGVVGRIQKTDTGTSTHSVTLQANGTKRDGYVYEYDREGIAMTTYNWNSNICKPLKDTDGAYLIRTAPELAYFQNIYNNIRAYDVYKLMANINLYSKPWGGMVLGDEATFDGNGFKISNIKITVAPDNYSWLDGVGFFSYTNAYTTIKNLTLSTVKIGTSSEPIEYSNVGGLVGHSACTEIANCTAQYVSIYTKSTPREYTPNGMYVGGLVGYLSGGNGRGKISNCLVTFPSKYYGMTGTAVMGGLIGRADGDVEITDSKLYVNTTSPFITVNSEAATALGDNYEKYVGSIGYFVGQAGTISFKGCQFSTDNKTWADPVDFTDAQWSAFDYAEKRTPKGTAYVGQVFSSSVVTVNDTQWTAGTDYNVVATPSSGE